MNCKVAPLQNPTTTCESLPVTIDLEEVDLQSQALNFNQEQYIDADEPMQTFIEQPEQIESREVASLPRSAWREQDIPACSVAYSSDQSVRGSVKQKHAASSGKRDGQDGQPQSQKHDANNPPKSITIDGKIQPHPQTSKTEPIDCDDLYSSGQKYHCKDCVGKVVSVLETHSKSHQCYEFLTCTSKNENCPICSQFRRKYFYIYILLFQSKL